MNVSHLPQLPHQPQLPYQPQLPHMPQLPWLPNFPQSKQRFEERHRRKTAERIELEYGRTESLQDSRNVGRAASRCCLHTCLDKLRDRYGKGLSNGMITDSLWNSVNAAVFKMKVLRLTWSSSHSNNIEAIMCTIIIGAN